MNFPIKTTDLKIDDLRTDEEATLVVIEAILNNDVEQISFLNSDSSKSLIDNLQSWAHYEEYCDLVSEQKHVLNLPLNNFVSLKNMEKASTEESANAVNQIKNRLEANNRINYQKQYKIFTVAACFIVLAMASIAFFNVTDMNNTASKTNASEDQISLKSDSRSNGSDTNTASGVDPTTNTPLLSYNSLKIIDLGSFNSIEDFKTKMMLSYPDAGLLDNRKTPRTYSILLSKLFNKECSDHAPQEQIDLYFLGKVAQENTFGFIDSKDGEKTPIILNC